MTQSRISDTRAPRLHVTDDLARGVILTLADAQAHYVRDVMRRGAGDALMLFNGRDGEWRGQITTADKKRVTIEIAEQTRPQRDEPDICLLFAPIKRAHLDYMIEKASELGVAHLRPVMTERTIAERVKEERLHAIAVEAAEQCERLTVPQLHTPLPLREALGHIEKDRVVIFCAEAGDVMPIYAALSQNPPGGLTWRKSAILVGPEGGFTREELAMVRAMQHVVPVGLGPRILRADTAAISALACWQAICGDWQTAGAPRPPYPG